jgi:hypothetical protein
MTKMYIQSSKMDSRNTLLRWKRASRVHLYSRKSDDNDIPPRHLLVLISSASLVFVDIIGCCILTEKILQREILYSLLEILLGTWVYICALLLPKEELMCSYKCSYETNPLKQICSLSFWGINVEDYRDWREKSILIIKKMAVNLCYKLF